VIGHILEVVVIYQIINEILPRDHSWMDSEWPYLCSKHHPANHKRAFAPRWPIRWVASNPQSDLLTMLKAVGAFEYAGGTSEFCDDNLLRYKVRPANKTKWHSLFDLLYGFPG
jgi:hypothetical protein